MEDYQYLESVVANIILDESEYKYRKLISLISKAMAFKGYPEGNIKKVILGVYLMDIGLHVESEDKEYELHPVRGCLYINTSRDLEITKNVVLLHHEKNDGTGFPYGLYQKDIPEYVQLVSLCKQYLINKDVECMSDKDNFSTLCKMNDLDLVTYLFQNVLKK